MKVTKAFKLSNAHVNTIDISHNRSAALNHVLEKTIQDPSRILRALQSRLNGAPSTDDNSTRVCVTLSVKVADGLETLTKRLGIAAENVVRLSVEAEKLEGSSTQ